MKKFFVIIVGIVIVFTLFILIFNSVMSPLKELDKKSIGRTLVFNNKDTIYISASSWGLAGNNEQIIFSETPITTADKEKHYIFYTDEVLYKINNNTLTIYAPQSGKNIPTTPFKNVEVVFKGLKTADEIRDYSLNHSKYGLTKLSIFDKD